MNHLPFTAVLLGAVYVLNKVEAHLDTYLTACQTNSTSVEDEQHLDGEEMFYIDFQEKKVVTVIPEYFGKWTMEGQYELAVQNVRICLENVKVAAEGENFPPEEIDAPQSTIHSMEEVMLGKRNTLICFVNNFHPPPVKVKWTKNNVEVKDGVALSRYYLNSDFTYQQFATLSIIPEEGDIYSCTVEHKGLEEPDTKFWEPEAYSESDMAASVFCGVGLTLGLLGVGVGTFFLIKGNNCN